MSKGPTLRQDCGPRRVGRVLWSLIIWRHWCREPWLTLMLGGILALGVGVFLSVRLANKAAVSGFTLFTESVSEQSDLILRPRGGQFHENVLRELRSVTGRLPVDYFPVLELPGTPAGEEETGLIRLVGVDLVAIGNALGQKGEVSGEGSFSRSRGGQNLLGESNAAFSGDGFAKARGVEEGEGFTVWVRDRSVNLRLAAILPDPANRPALPENLCLMDLPALQELAGCENELSRVEVRFPAGPKAEALASEVIGRLSDFAREKGLLLETPEERKSSITQMSAAFRFNLAILSGLALLVGVYLILQAMEAAVTKRRGEIAILRSLGVMPEQIRRTWLTEALVLGLIGSLAGIVLGRLLASGLVGAIAGTVNTLYYETTTEAVKLDPGEVVFALLFGVSASLLAGWIPAREAALTPPAQSMRQGGQGGGLLLLRRWPVGCVLLGAALGVAWLPPLDLPGHIAFPLGGYLSALAAVLGGSVLLCRLFTPVSNLLSWRAEAMRRYAASRLAVVGGRHRLTAAGLSAAIGMSAAMAILVASFEHTLTSWIGQILKADLYVAAPGAASTSNDNLIPEADWRRILDLAGIDGADSLLRQTIVFEGREVLLGGADYHDDPERHLQLLWIKPPPDPGPRGLVEGAWISEPFSRRFGKGIGDLLEIETPAGLRQLPVTGVYADYGNESGTILVSRERCVEWFGDTGVSNLALYLSPGIDPEEVLERLRVEFPFLVARTNAKLRGESIRIFHQTFAVTYALEAIAVIIAVGGLGLALAGLLLERRSELSTLRALGATRRDIARAAMWESGGIAFAGLAGGLAVSFFLGWVLIEVINPQSFGWTLRYAIPWMTFGGLSLVTLSTAMLVGWIVGYRHANLRSDREE